MVHEYDWQSQREAINVSRETKFVLEIDIWSVSTELCRPTYQKEIPSLTRCSERLRVSSRLAGTILARTRLVRATFFSSSYAFTSLHHAATAPRSAVAELGVVKRLRTPSVKRKIIEWFVALIITVGVLGYGAYSVIYYPYFALPRQDQAFLAAHPRRDAVLRHFGHPAEELHAGERFTMTGWYPLPERPASYSALSFVRRYGSKLYVYFGAEGEMEDFVISHS